ncbi:MAG: DNA-processing protein DprA [Candidatus Sumerlaeota bacterium]|nr:DNA-processing protein DprA [Candidatus Sumerlaeota bacterium]
MDNSYAIALLCAPAREEGMDVAPLTPAKWADLREALQGAGLQGPAALGSLAEDEMVSRLKITGDEAARLRRLFEREEFLAREIERLAELGIWIVTQEDEEYPGRLREYLERQAPPLLFGAGNKRALDQGGLAIVGSRSISDEGNQFAKAAAAACTTQGIAVISGAARGVDQIAMNAALGEGGGVIGVVADSLENQLKRGETREAVEAGCLALITPFHPSAPFSAGLAMARNKFIYALADWALIVRADLNKGGSWSGAVEALRKKHRVPVFVRDDAEAGPGNAELLRRGALALAIRSPQRHRDTEKYTKSIFHAPIRVFLCVSVSLW